nr:shikimate dehydrogenase [Clostridia bacterium]
MKYGCIGERLGHSFSKEIHGLIGEYEYELREVERDELEKFATDKDFLGINVTIPYKERIIPYLYNIDTSAEKIGSVNTVVNRGGRLFGYNTDYFGMESLLEHAGIDPNGKKVVILGTGGTSKTAYTVVSDLGAREIVKVSRRESESAISYERLYREHTDAEIIINTTPVGMYPTSDGLSLDISEFGSLVRVIDAVYNPIRTHLIQEALARGIAAEGGLYMLVAQAVRASEIFLDTSYPEDTIEKIYNRIIIDKENVVLIGMPSSGKSTVGKILSEMLGKRLVETDKIIEEKSGITIPEIFEAEGEAAFREKESEIIAEVANGNGAVISTGGGVLLRPVNIERLRRNGRVYFIDRPLELLTPTKDRPTASDRAAIEKRYTERYDKYLSLCDRRVDGAKDAHLVAKEIAEDFLNENIYN